MSRLALAALLALTLTAHAVAQADGDVERAIDALRARATAGDAVAQFSLGSLLYYGTPETVQGIEWFRKAATQRFPSAEFQMGQVYDFGFSVARDDAQALAW